MTSLGLRNMLCRRDRWILAKYIVFSFNFVSVVVLWLAFVMFSNPRRIFMPALDVVRAPNVRFLDDFCIIIINLILKSS